MHKSFLGIAGAAAALGLGALAAQPVQAQGFSITISSPGYAPGYYAPPAPAPVYRPYPAPRPVYYRPAPRPHPAYAPVYYRPAAREYPVYAPVTYAPRCTTEVTRRWDGWGWVSRRTRICD